MIVLSLRELIYGCPSEALNILLRAMSSGEYRLTRLLYCRSDCTEWISIYLTPT